MDLPGREPSPPPTPFASSIWREAQLLPGLNTLVNLDLGLLLLDEKCDSHQDVKHRSGVNSLEPLKQVINGS